MKSFLNVLYRRILYKIPLKWLLLGLVVFAILLSSFSNADSYVCTPYFVGGNDYISSPGTLGMRASYNNLETTRFCFTPITDGVQYSLDNSNRTSLPKYNAVCFNKNEFGNYNTFYWKGDSNIETVYRSRFEGNCFGYTSLQCQTEYNLIPIESVDQNYCESNNLCPSQECPVCPVGTGGYSQLYINNILHLGAPNIIMNISDEIDWDYAYTAGGQNMNIDVVGYNVDYEKIDSIVAFQNYKPSGEDFQRIIGLLAPYTKIIVFFVFLFIIWAWIKKPFKSKKL